MLGASVPLPIFYWKGEVEDTIWTKRGTARKGGTRAHTTAREKYKKDSRGLKEK